MTVCLVCLVCRKPIGPDDDPIILHFTMTFILHRLPCAAELLAQLGERMGQA